MKQPCKRNHFDISAWYSLHQIIPQINKHKEDIDFPIVFVTYFYTFSPKFIAFIRNSNIKMYQDQPPSYSEAINSQNTPTAPSG